MISACIKTDHLWYLYTQVNIGYLLNCFFLPKFNVKTFFVYFFFITQIFHALILCFSLLITVWFFFLCLYNWLSRLLQTHVRHQLFLTNFVSVHYVTIKMRSMTVNMLFFVSSSSSCAMLLSLSFHSSASHTILCWIMSVSCEWASFWTIIIFACWTSP